MADFYAARSGTIPPLPWTNFAPPLSKPLIALALAIIPFFLFIGATDTATVNGEVVRDSRFNLGGLIMGLIGLVMAFTVLRPSAPKDTARKTIAVIAGLLCLVQIANSVELIRIEPLDWIMPDRNLPELTYSGLAENDAIYLTVKTPDAYRRALTREKGEIVGKSRAHKTYADLCHGGRYRTDLQRAEKLSNYFNDEEQTTLNQHADRQAKGVPTECTGANSNRIMGRETDDLNRNMDLFDRLEKEYLASIQ